MQVDAWVPSFVPDTASDDQKVQTENSSVAGSESKPIEEKQNKCRLCFAGSIVAKQVIIGDAAAGQVRRAMPLSADDQFNLSAFGDYSESFSFDVGCGLPGRVYHMGVPTWEQSVCNAPLHHFERVGGSQQWGIKTVVGIPVPSPNVGRIVVVLYSRHDRFKDHDLVIRLTEEFSRLLPSPKWKLVVDIGSQSQPVEVQSQQHQQQEGSETTQQNNTNSTAAAAPDSATLTSEVISIFGEHMPSDQSNPAFAYLQGFMSLRLLLLRSSRSEQEQDIVNTILSSYSSYKAGGRTRPDIATMLARDFIFLQQSSQQQQQQKQLSQMQMQPNNGQQQMSQVSYGQSQIQNMNIPPPLFPRESPSALMQQQVHQQYHQHADDQEAASLLLGELAVMPQEDDMVATPSCAP